jgi:hypothetical protein
VRNEKKIEKSFGIKARKNLKKHTNGPISALFKKKNRFFFARHPLNPTSGDVYAVTLSGPWPLLPFAEEGQLSPFSRK